MKHLVGILILGLFLSLSACFSRTEKSPEVVTVTSEAPKAVVKPTMEPVKDKSLTTLTKYFEQADSIHREAWWVLTGERSPVGKSPFGKTQRALLSSQNIKLSNKSMFRCDRYVVKRDVLGISGYPQKAEIFEKCSEKIEAKKIAQFFSPGPFEVQATFYPENLEEILGLGATVLNRSIQCTLKGNDKDQLTSLQCKDWAQDRTKEQMIRLDVYDYQKEGKNLIKLRGKVYENLSDTRKIEADVPLEGKVYVTETELYPPEEPTPVVTKTPTPKATPAATTAKQQGGAQAINPEGEQYSPGADHGIPDEGAVLLTPAAPNAGGSLVPAPRQVGEPAVDPDVLMMQQNQQQQQMYEEGGAPPGVLQPMEPAPQNPPAGDIYGR